MKLKKMSMNFNFRQTIPEITVLKCAHSFFRDCLNCDEIFDHPSYSNDVSYLDTQMLEHCSAPENIALMGVRRSLQFTIKVQVETMEANERAAFVEMKKRF